MSAMLRRIFLVICSLAMGILDSQEAAAIENGVRVPRDQVLGTGAVYLFHRDSAGELERLCSGMLVTRRWVLAAGHCQRAVLARLGNEDDPNRIEVSVESAYSHPQRTPGVPENGFDVGLIRLVAPIYLRRADGRRWEDYRRDIYRGSESGLNNKQIDVYGYGATERWNREGEPVGDGVLRFGKFKIVWVGDKQVHMDSRQGGAKAWAGDSGAAALEPAHDGAAIRTNYRIVAILSQTIRRFAWDWEVDGPHAVSFREWFDGLVGNEIKRTAPASSIMAAIGRY